VYSEVLFYTFSPAFGKHGAVNQYVEPGTLTDVKAGAVAQTGRVGICAESEEAERVDEIASEDVPGLRPRAGKWTGLPCLATR
jgi:hypothetical protein